VVVLPCVPGRGFPISGYDCTSRREADSLLIISLQDSSGIDAGELIGGLASASSPGVAYMLSDLRAQDNGFCDLLAIFTEFLFLPGCP